MKWVKVEFMDKNLTGQAGFIYMERFIGKLGLPYKIWGRTPFCQGIFGF